MVSDLEHRTYKERLRKLVYFSLDKVKGVLAARCLQIPNGKAQQKDKRQQPQVTNREILIGFNQKSPPA